MVSISNNIPDTTFNRRKYIQSPWGSRITVVEGQYTRFCQVMKLDTYGLQRTLWGHHKAHQGFHKIVAGNSPIRQDVFDADSKGWDRQGRELK